MSEKLLSRQKVADLFDTHVNTIRNWCDPKSPYYVKDFPQPTKFGNRCLRWHPEDIERYMSGERAA